jgi:hypothetical protein
MRGPLPFIPPPAKQEGEAQAFCSALPFVRIFWYGDTRMESAKNNNQEKLAGHGEQKFSVAGLIARSRQLSWKIMIPVCIALAGLVLAGWHWHWDARLVGAGVFGVAILSNVIGWLLALVALIPFFGPLIVQVLALPMIYFLNALGSVISFVAVRRGYSRDVLTYRGLTIALIVGIVIGFVIGKLV